jgi:hypothetical protein
VSGQTLTNTREVQIQIKTKTGTAKTSLLVLDLERNASADVILATLVVPKCQHLSLTWYPGKLLFMRHVLDFHFCITVRDITTIKLYSTRLGLQKVVIY